MDPLTVDLVAVVVDFFELRPFSDPVGPFCTDDKLILSELFFEN